MCLGRQKPPQYSRRDDSCDILPCYDHLRGSCRPGGNPIGDGRAEQTHAQCPKSHKAPAKEKETAINGDEQNKHYRISIFICIKKERNKKSASSGLRVYSIYMRRPAKEWQLTAAYSGCSLSIRKKIPKKKLLLAIRSSFFFASLQRPQSGTPSKTGPSMRAEMRHSLLCDTGFTHARNA